MNEISELLDLERYPLDRLEGAQGRALIARCKAALAEEGLFELEGLVRAPALRRMVAELTPTLEAAAFTHAREHNVYFEEAPKGVAPDHPALRRFHTVNHTICADQFASSAVLRIYEWPPLRAFLAAVMDKPALHLMADPLARVNVMGYGAGDGLNWHFDRSEFTTTLLLQAPEAGGVFEHRPGLRSEIEPNFDGVARLIEGRDREVRRLAPAAGALNVFKGKNTAHRVTPVEGARRRLIAVFSYYERPGVVFSAEERIGFYGRAE